MPEKPWQSGPDPSFRMPQRASHAYVRAGIKPTLKSAIGMPSPGRPAHTARVECRIAAGNEGPHAGRIGQRPCADRGVDYTPLRIPERSNEFTFVAARALLRGADAGRS